MSNEKELTITERLRARIKPFTRHKVWRWIKKFKAGKVDRPL